jgi:hypothetical protein
MIEDDVIRGVRAAREGYARAHGYSIRAMVSDLQAKDSVGDWPVVSLPARRPRTVGLSSDEFLRLLGSGKGAGCIYREGEVGGMIAIYYYNEVFVIHWEEYRDEDRRNKSAYLRDEMHWFDSPEEVLSFVEQAGYPATAFSP